MALEPPRGLLAQRREDSGHLLFRKPVPLASCLQLSKHSPEGTPEARDPPPEAPRSPLYADPYTPPATSYHKITDVQGLDEVSSLWGTERAGCVHRLRSTQP